MAVSQPLGLGDKLREAIADAQRVLDSMDLRGKLKLDTVVGSSSSGVEASLDRTEKNARDAAEKSIIGSDSSGPLSPNDRLVDALNRLMKSLDGLPDSLDRGPRRRGRKGGGGGDAGGGEDEGGGGGGGGGYVNPYLLQGMIQNPIGTARSSLWSMLMGGSGTGMKPPGFLLKALAGSSGELSIGKALGAETLGGASQFLSTGAIAAAGAATFATAFAKTMSMQMDAANDRTKDADQYMLDVKFGNNLGVNWRRGAWMDQFQSRRDIWQNDIREIMVSANVGLNGLGGPRGDVGAVDAMQLATNVSYNLGVSGQQVGSLLGAGVRSGSLSLRDGDGDLKKYLSLIENWTRQAAERGFSSNEALQRMAEVSQKAQHGTGGLATRGAIVSLLSMDERARVALPKGLERTGVPTGLDALGAAAGSDTQTAMMMNEFLGSDGNLTGYGREVASKILGPEQLGIMEKQYGRFAGTAIAHQLTKTDLGRKLARGGAYRKMTAAGASGAGAALTIGSGDWLGDALGMTIVSDKQFGKDLKILSEESGLEMRTRGVDDVQERDLARLGQQMQRLSGLTAESAVALRQLSSQVKSATRALTDWLDHYRQTYRGPWTLGESIFYNPYNHGPEPR